MRGLAGKGVLITGGTSGIGLATARRFLQEGARVFVCGLDGVDQALKDLKATQPANETTEPVNEGTKAVSEGTNAVSETTGSVNDPEEPEAVTGRGLVAGCRCDVSAEEEVVRLVAEARAFLGTVDVLINNAGTAWREPFLEITAEHWDRLMSVNLRGMFLVAQAVSREMVSTGTRGAIVNMSSTNGLGGEAEYAHYNASKGGVLLLTKTMAVELGGHGIRVNAVCPGYIRTPLNSSITPDEAFVAAYERDHIPLGRAGRAEEVAAAYAFLASDDASFVNGAELVIDGGQLAIM